MKKYVKIFSAIFLLGILLAGTLVIARPRQIKRVYVHVCDKYLAHIKIVGGKITKLHPTSEILEVLNPEIPGNSDINSETIWVFVDSWNPADFEKVSWIATAIWRDRYQPPIPAFNIDAACWYTENDMNSQCWFHDWELGYRQMRNLAIGWERNKSWPEWDDIPDEIKEAVK